MKPTNLKVNVQFCVESVFDETMGAGACQRAGIRSRTSSISCVLWPFGRGATTFQTSGMVGGTKVPHKKSRLDQSKFVLGKMGSQLKPWFRRCFSFQKSQSFQQSHVHGSRIVGPLSGLRRPRGPWEGAGLSHQNVGHPAILMHMHMHICYLHQSNMTALLTWIIFWSWKKQC